MSYKKLWIQKMPYTSRSVTTNNGQVSVVESQVVPESIANDTSEKWGIWCMDIPFHVGGEAKDLPSNDWGDLDGIEEYLPQDGLHFKEYDITIKFGWKSESAVSPYLTANAAMKAFREYLSGREQRQDGNNDTYSVGVYMMIYHEGTNIGRRNVRFVSMSDQPTYIWSNNNKVRAIFDVKLRINDPLTDVALNAGGALATL